MNHRGDQFCPFSTAVQMMYFVSTRNNESICSYQVSGVHLACCKGTGPWVNKSRKVCQNQDGAEFTRADGHSTQRSHVTVGALRCASGDASQRSTSDFQRRCMQTSTPALAVEVLSTIAGGLRPAGPGATSGLPTWSNFSTSTDKPSKKAQGLMEGGGVDGVPLAAADVAQVAEPTKDEPRHAHIEMPSITDAERVATLTSWNVKVGDVIQVGDVVCEIELEQFSVGVKVETTGFLAEILVDAGTEGVPVGADIGTIVHSEEDIALYQQAQETPAPAREEHDNASEPVETFSWKNVLRDVLRLRQENKLSEDDASALMSLARNKDSELLQAFEGCFEGDEYKGEIDDELFLAQVIDIARTRTKK
ncbi:unnamed protein product [Pylaiella littoralis]